MWTGVSAEYLDPDPLDLMGNQYTNRDACRMNALANTKATRSLDWYGLRAPSVWYDMTVTHVRTEHFRHEYV